jgi:hypothetical protein
MSTKKKDKRLAHANMVWERSQLKAAMAAEQIDKAVAAVEQYRDELTEQQITDIKAQVELQKKEIESFLIKERDKYAAKLDELNLEAVIQERLGDGSKPKLVNLGDL